MILNWPTIFANTSTIIVSRVSDPASCLAHSTWEVYGGIYGWHRHLIPSSAMSRMIFSLRTNIVHCSSRTFYVQELRSLLCPFPIYNTRFPLPYTDAEGSASGYPYAAASHKIGRRSFATDFWMRYELSLPYRFYWQVKASEDNIPNHLLIMS